MSMIIADGLAAIGVSEINIEWGNNYISFQNMPISIPMLNYHCQDPWNNGHSLNFCIFSFRKINF